MTIPRFCKSCLERLEDTEHDVCSKVECLDKERITREGVLSRSKEVMLRMLEADVERFETTPMLSVLAQLGNLATKVKRSKFDDVTWAVKEREALIAGLERNEKLVQCTCAVKEAAAKGESLKDGELTEERRRNRYDLLLTVDREHQVVTDAEVDEWTMTFENKSDMPIRLLRFMLAEARAT